MDRITVANTRSAVARKNLIIMTDSLKYFAILSELKFSSLNYRC